MIIYVFTFITISLWLYAEKFKDYKNRALNAACKYTLTISLLIFLCCLSALRWDTGQDFHEYIAIYNYTPSLFSGDNIFRGYGNIEPGFRLIASIAKIFDSHIVYLGLCAILSLFPLYLGLSNFSKHLPINISYAILVYFCFFYINYNFNAMRQAITMGFFVYSITYMYERKTFNIVLISLLLTLVHSTGILILLSYIASRIILVNSYRKLVLIILVSLVAYKVDILTQLFSLLGVNITIWQEKWGAISLSSIILRLIIIGLLVFPKPIFKVHKLGALLFTLYMCGFILYLSLGSVDMMATRFNMFFRVLEVLMIPLLIKAYRFNINKSLVTGLIFVLLSLVLWVTVLMDENFYNFLTV